MKDKSINRILQETHDIYNTIAKDFSDTRKKWWRGFGNFDRYLKPGDSVVDLGCGNGRMAETFLQAKVKYLGIDDSEELIKIAKERYQDNSNISFMVGNVTDLNLPQNEFNLAIIIAVLHHIPGEELKLKIFKDVFKILKPGGYIVISTWNLWRFKYLKKYFFKSYNWKQKIIRRSWNIKDAFVPWKATGLPVARYAHAFTKRELKSMLVKAGFEVEEIYYGDQVEASKKVGCLIGSNLIAIARKK